MKRFVSTIIGCLAIMLISCNNHPLRQELNLGWTLTTDTLGINIKVGVPSVVQTDLYEAGLIPHPYEGTVEKSLQWITEQPWTYTLNFDINKNILKQDVVELVFEGVDGYADAWLNGTHLCSFDNMFIGHSWNVKDIAKAKGNELIVKTRPYYKTQDSIYSRLPIRLPEHYAVSRQAAYQHGWDWAPRYTNAGIWKPIYLKGWSKAQIASASITTTGIENNVAHLNLDIEFKSNEEQTVKIHVLNDNEQICIVKTNLEATRQRTSIKFDIQNPELWWPNGHGEQELYNFEIRLTDESDNTLDSKALTAGIRTIELIDQPDEFGRRFYFEVNGQPIYAKGANYIPEDMFTPWMNRERTKQLLTDCAKANFNMLRVWGGGIYPYDYFFDICDSLGIMVWEDFMFAGTMYPYDEHFLNSVSEEASQQVKRLARHPSLAIWCGNNEVSEGYYNWGWQQLLCWTEEQDREIKKGYDTLFENILPRIVEEYGHCDYWASSPANGWGRAESLLEGDVHYWGVWWGDSLFDTYRNKVGRFCSEYGYQSLPDMATIKRMDSNEDIQLGSDVLKAHEKHARGFELIDLQLKEYFPSYSTLDDYVYLSQVSQAYGLGMAIEAQRDRKPYCMGSLYWQVNDAWPVISWSSIDCFGNYKALQYRLKELYAPISITDRYIVSDILTNQNARFSLDVFSTTDNKSISHNEKDIRIRANSVLPLDINLSISEEQKSDYYLYIRLDYEGHQTEHFRYYCKPKELNLAPQDISFRTKEDGSSIELIMSCKALMKDVRISSNVEGTFSDNYFDLCPSVNKIVVFTPARKVDADKVEFYFKTMNQLK